MRLKNKLIKAAFLFLRLVDKKRPLPSKKRKFLIVSTTGLGDTLWATPALKALRQTHTDAYIAALVSPLAEEVLKYNPHINELFVLKKPHFFSFLFNFFKLREKKIDTVLLFHASQRFTFPFCALLKPSEIIGTEGLNKGLDFLLTRSIEKKPIHEIARRLEIASCFEQLKPKDQVNMELFLGEEDKKKAEEWLEELSLAQNVPLVALHPGAKDKFKQWNPACFVEVGKRLVQELGCYIIVTGSKEEKTLVSRIAAQIVNATPLCGELSVRALGALMRRFSLMIANDTGPMHIAFAVNLPTIALFTPTDPNLCGPFGSIRACVIEKKPTCGPCLRKKCRDPFCLLQISPKEVYHEALKVLKNA